MSAIQIADNVTSVGVKDPHLAVYDIVIPITHGTTYNACLVKNKQVALIDTVKTDFVDKYLADVQQVTPLDRIEFLIINCSKPDHSGGISAEIG